MGADSHWSSPLPWGTPSITSTRTTRLASSLSARRWATVAPTLPAPTTVILFIIEGRLPSARMHLAVGIGAQRVDPVERAAVGHAEALFSPPIGAALPRSPDERGELLVRGTPAQRLAQIDAPPGVQTQEPRSVRGDAAAVAGAAERRGDRGDDPEGGAVRQAEPLGGGPLVVADRVDRLDRSIALAEHLKHLPLGHHLVPGPAGRAAHVHVLDKPHLGVVGAGELDQIGQLIIVNPRITTEFSLRLLNPAC